MTTIPDAARQAAAEVIDRVRRNRAQTSGELADAALGAAMPAIREAIAQELEAADEDIDLRSPGYDAARIVRGGGQ